jgi:hypothetical protein
MGIVVPAATPADVNKDSVELLLDGITGPQPERTRTKPQTDGEASAAYHARHDVRAARTSPDDEPKVVIERVAQPPTIRIDRSTIRQVEEAISRAALEPTAVVPPQTGPRVVVAVLAGLVVVLVLFVALRASSRRTGGHAVTSSVNVSAPSATATDPRLLAVPPPPAIASASAGANVGEAEPTSASAESTPAASADLVTGAAGLAPRPRSPAGPASSGAPKPRTKAAPSASAPKDLGELKTSFH